MTFRSPFVRWQWKSRRPCHTDVCSIYLLNSGGTEYVLAATDGLNQAQVGIAKIPRDAGLVGQVGKRAEPINLDDAQSHPAFHYLEGSGEEAYNAFLGVPIIHQRRTLGVLVVQQVASRRFDESEEAFLVTLAAQLAITVAHAEAIGQTRFAGNQSKKRQDTCFVGVGGAPGIAIGTAVAVHHVVNFEAIPEREADNTTTELMLFDRALQAVRHDIQRIIDEFTNSLPTQEMALFEAYLHMLDDNALAGDIRQRIREGQWAQGALKQVIREHVRRFEAMEDAYLRERGTDVKDLGLRLLANLQDIRDKKSQFPVDTVLVGEEVTPAMLANIPAERLRAIVSIGGSRNSHMGDSGPSHGHSCGDGRGGLPGIRCGRRNPAGRRTLWRGVCQAVQAAHQIERRAHGAGAGIRCGTRRAQGSALHYQGWLAHAAVG